ncbi:MAG: ester cyclase [Candidatus Eisenbacteria bacterium]
MVATLRSDLERIARRWIEEIWRPGDLVAFDELHAPEFRDRSAAGRGDTRDDYRRMLVAFYAAFPDFRTAIEDLVVDESSGSVAIRWTARGTHRGAYLGVAPSGRAIDFAGIEIIRVEGGRIVERWGEWDGMSLLAQLGLWGGPP